MNKLKSKHYNDLSKSEVINEIRDYLTSQIDLIRREKIDSEGYSRQAWPYYQADKNGQERAYLKLLDYLPEKL